MQELKITKEVTCYRRARYLLPDGSYKIAPLPANINGHFGNELKKYIAYQSHSNNVSQPRIHQELSDIGIYISEGEISNIALEVAALLKTEYKDVAQTGISCAENLGVDDTSDWHCGDKGYCLVIQNEFFTYFMSSNSKSRKNFLEALRVNNCDYILNNTALEYVKNYKPKPDLLQKLQTLHGKIYSNANEWYMALKEADVTDKNTGAKLLKVIDEAALLGSAVEHGLDPKTVILSDGAKQFIILIHALCWIHAERAIKKLIPKNDAEAAEIKALRGQLWDYYEKLEQYKENPTPEEKLLLTELFDTVFAPKDCCKALNDVLVDFRRKKKSLLAVLEHPKTPLHNNSSEQDIRRPVVKRKISGCTRTAEGRTARNIFTSLILTCRKLRISFWSYLSDRIEKAGNFPYLPDLIRQKSCQGPPI